jgi:rod shape-determining protein MreC
VVLGVLVIAALALVTFDARGASPAASLRSAGSGVFGRAESAAAAIGSPFARLYDAFTSGPAAQSRIAALQRQVLRLRLQLGQARLARSEEAQLQQLLQLAGRGQYRVVAANVIARGPAYEETVTIDAGSADGIKPSETVLNGAGLVGTVTSVTAHTSTVLLITDAATTVGVRMAGTGQIGAATGTGRGKPGPGLLRLQVFDASAVLRPGQQLVTFGSVGGQPYVPGVPVGVITRVTGSANSLTKLAVVRPFASETSLGVIGVVIVPPRQHPRDSVLPPKPRSGPVATPTPAGTRKASAAPSPGATPAGG